MLGNRQGLGKVCKFDLYYWIIFIRKHQMEILSTEALSIVGKVSNQKSLLTGNHAYELGHGSFTILS